MYCSPCCPVYYTGYSAALILVLLYSSFSYYPYSKKFPSSCSSKAPLKDYHRLNHKTQSRSESCKYLAQELLYQWNKVNLTPSSFRSLHHDYSICLRKDRSPRSLPLRITISSLWIEVQIILVHTYDINISWNIIYQLLVRVNKGFTNESYLTLLFKIVVNKRGIW